jgi:ABC-type phosphate/phosphonate transport system permease subunit
MAENGNYDVRLAILENEMDNMKRREEDYRRNKEREDDKRDERIQKLEDADDYFQRESTNNEKNKFGLWVTVIVAFGSTVIGAILAQVFSMFTNSN